MLKTWVGKDVQGFCFSYVQFKVSMEVESLKLLEEGGKCQYMVVSRTAVGYHRIGRAYNGPRGWICCDGLPRLGVQWL